jgi:uncharacterized membrane protein YkvA (DUF1232 family)
MSRDAWILISLLSIVAIATLAGAIWLVIRLVRTRKMLVDLGTSGKVAFYGALIYTIFPVDLLPDPIYLDDMGVLTAAIIYLTRQVHRYRASQRLAAPAPPPAPAPRPRVKRG